MKKTAKVKFIGNPDEYKLGCDYSEYRYCRDCNKKDCEIHTHYQFDIGKVYNAYFLEYWQGKRDSLHVKGEDSKIDDFIPLEDFEIIEDVDDVLNLKEAIVRCISCEFACNETIALTKGKEYKAIGVDRHGYYLVMDDSLDCYFYAPKYFEIVSDPFQLLDLTKSYPVYCFSNYTE